MLDFIFLPCWFGKQTEELLTFCFDIGGVGVWGVCVRDIANIFGECPRGRCKQTKSLNSPELMSFPLLSCFFLLILVGVKDISI